MILDAMPAGQPWLFGLMLWRTALRQAEPPKPGVARSAIRQHPTVRHGPEWKGRAVSRGAGPPRACGRLSLGPSPEPCGQGVHRARWQATIPKERGPLDCRGDCKSGPGDGRHRNWRQRPCLPSLRHSCARHWLQSGLNVNAVSAWLGHSSSAVTLNTYLVLAPDTLGDISEVP